jgi:hypothetical protein
MTLDKHEYRQNKEDIGGLTWKNLIFRYQEGQDASQSKPLRWRNQKNILFLKSSEEIVLSRGRIT